MEQQLVAAVGVLLPARQLVVDGEGNAFFEAFAGPGGEADDVAVCLQSCRHVSQVMRIIGDGEIYLSDISKSSET